MTCPSCREPAKFQGYRAKSLLSLLGEVSAPRAYYYCPRCHAGHCPWDRTLGLSARALTPAAAEVTGLAGTLTGFEDAREALAKLSGLRLAESTVRRTTEAAGRRLGEALERGETFGPAKDWAWHRDATGATCAYVSLDATGVPQQGPEGAKAPGRMAYVAALYNPTPEGAPSGPSAGRTTRYLAGLSDLDAVGARLRRQAAQVGMDRAERWIALSDGGSGLERFFAVQFPRAECIIDFWHVAGYLAALGAALHPEDEAGARSWTEAICHRLKHEGGAAVLSELEGLGLQRRRGTVRAEAERVLTYFRNQVHRMDYPRYRAQGWQIGSGPVESACKAVVGMRLKGAGMRWGEAGTDAVCHLRALWCSGDGQWDAFWKAHPN
ncbi:MAG TPA: ISKra4 family transposase [Thermoanaerobaculia bacterium]